MQQEQKSVLHTTNTPTKTLIETTKTTEKEEGKVQESTQVLSHNHSLQAERAFLANSRHTSPINLVDDASGLVDDIKQPQSKGSLDRRPIISKMIMTQSEHNEIQPVDRSRPRPLGSPKNNPSPKNKLLSTSITLNASGNVVQYSARVNPLKTGEAVGININENRKIDENVQDQLKKHNMMNTENTEEQDDSQDLGQTGMLHSRCNSEILSQKYEGSATKLNSIDRLKSEKPPINIIESNPYALDLHSNGEERKKSGKRRGPHQKQQSIKQTNRSAGAATSMISERSRTQPKTQLKMIMLENKELSEKSRQKGFIGDNPNQRHKSTTQAENVTPKSTKALNSKSASTNKPINIAPLTINQDMKVVKMPNNKQSDNSPMTFFNRQKTKLIQKTNSDEEASNEELLSNVTGDSKSATFLTGPDRSTTSHLNIKLPPMMSGAIKKNTNSGDTQTQMNVVGPTKSYHDMFKVIPLEGNEENFKPTISATKKQSTTNNPVVLQKSGTFCPHSPQGKIMSKNSNSSSKKIIEDDPKVQIGQTRRTRTITQIKTSQKIAIPIFNQNHANSPHKSPLSNKKEDSGGQKDGGDEDQNFAEGGYKKFVIESPQKLNQEPQIEMNNYTISDEKHKDQSLRSRSPKDMPPAGVQKVSFGMLPMDMQTMTAMQRASHLSEMDLQNQFGNTLDPCRESQDSQEQARIFYLSQNTQQAVLGTQVYNATTAIKKKTLSPKRGEFDLPNKLKVQQPISQSIAMEAVSKIEKISDNDYLQFIFLKLWSLHSKAEDIVESYFEKKQGKTIPIQKAKPHAFSPEATSQKITLRTVHQLLASISLGILLVQPDVFQLNDSILLINTLTKNEATNMKKQIQRQDNLANEKPICTFDQFKLILLSLFGSHILRMNEFWLDQTLRHTYKKITESSEPVFEQKKPKDKSSYMNNPAHDSLMMMTMGDSVEQSVRTPRQPIRIHNNNNIDIKAINQSKTTRNSTMQGGMSDIQVKYGVIKELNLMQLSDLIKLLKRQWNTRNGPKLHEEMMCVLAKFDLSVHKKINYTDYRSAFTEVQRQLNDSREKERKEKVTKKYAAPDPWECWSHTLGGAPAHEFPQKPCSFKAPNPHKLLKTETQQVSKSIPKATHKGRFQMFNFARVQQAKLKQQQQNVSVENNQISPSKQSQQQSCQEEEEAAGLKDTAKQGMFFKIDDMVRANSTMNQQQNSRKFGHKFSSLNSRLQKDAMTKKQAFIRSYNQKREQRQIQQQQEDYQKQREELSHLYDPLQGQQNDTIKTLLKAFQEGSLSPSAQLEQLIQPVHGSVPLIQSAQKNRPQSMYMNNRPKINRNMNFMTLQNDASRNEQLTTKRPGTQQQQAMNSYFNTISHTGAAFDRGQTARTTVMPSSNEDQGIEACSQMAFSKNYRPTLTGALSPNPHTGKVKVNYDKAQMSIVVIKDGEVQEDETRSPPLSMNSISVISTGKKLKNSGIAYGGRGPRSALQNRIGLDNKTAGQQQFDRQYLTYPVGDMNVRSNENSKPTINSNATLQQNKLIKSMPMSRTTRTTTAHTMSPILSNQMPHNFVQQTGMVRMTPDLVIDGTQEPMLRRESKRSPTQTRNFPPQQGAIFAIGDQAVFEQFARPIDKFRFKSQLPNQNPSHRNSIKLTGQSSSKRQYLMVSTDKKGPHDHDLAGHSTDDHQDNGGDSQIDLGGFTAHLQRTKTFEEDVSRRGTELTNHGNIIKTKQSLQHPKYQVDPSPDLVPDYVPDLKKTTTLLLKS